MEVTESVEDDSKLSNNGDRSCKKRKNPFNTQQRKDEKDRRQKKKARIVVRNLSYKTKEYVLSKHFSQFGKIEDLKLLKRPDGKLVGCAFIQFENVNQASKAILRGNKEEFLGRPLYIDWAVGKDDYIKNNKMKTDSKNHEVELKVEEESVGKKSSLNIENEDAEENGSGSDGEEDENVADDDHSANSDKMKVKTKIDKNRLISNDVQNGCTVFIKNVSFEAEDFDLRKVFRKFGPLHYAIINREPISGHSKGTAFVKFKSKESADLCLQNSGELRLNDQMLEPYPALSREEVRNQDNIKSNKNVTKDSRNLYLAREGLIMANSKSAEGVSASDMAKRHKLEQIKTQVLKNLNRFVSRNRLSIHNLPVNYDNEKLKQMVIMQTGFRPHECRVMRENKVTPEHPKGKSKGFGFMSFSTHQEALISLRKLNNNPNIFGVHHRPIVAFSIEDRAVEKIKEKRKEKSKMNNPTFQEKLKKNKEKRKLKKLETSNKANKVYKNDDKVKLKEHIKKIEESRLAKATTKAENLPADELDNFVGTAAKPGLMIRMRSNKKILEQSQEHKKHVRANKRIEKAKKIRQIHLSERKAVDRPKQGKRTHRDDLEPLIQKYKSIIDSQANLGTVAENPQKGLQMQKRMKWYPE